MAFDIKRVDYYDTNVEGHVGAASRLLSELAGIGVELLAYKAVPLESTRTRFTLLASDGARMAAGAARAGLRLDGPHSALYIRGDDEAGALADIYARLAEAEIGVRESSGLADIKGGYGVILYIEEASCERAMAALEE
jgi:hypothetical protein